jgi:hypothetical protein
MYKETPVQPKEIRNQFQLDLNAEELSKIFGTQDNFNMIKALLQTQQQNYDNCIKQYEMSKTS